MLNKEQAQAVGGGSTAVQAGGNIVITQVGLSYTEVRDVALDVFRSNFYQLAGPAMETAKARATEITEDFLKKLQAEHPEGFKKGQDPDFQDALFTIQKEYAKTGDKDLGDLLVDLLVDRSKQDQRDILQIVLNESLATAPKLTEAQLSALSIIFFFRYTQPLGIESHDSLAKHFDRHVLPFSERLVTNPSCYRHLEFASCGSVQMNEISLEHALAQTYQGLFLKGFEASEIETRGVTIGMDGRFFIPCLNNSAKFQVRAINRNALEQNIDANAISADDKAKILALFDVEKMSHAEIRETCIKLRPYMGKVFDTWSGSSMKSFTLTSVGMAIGHANIKRLIGEFASLSIWIN
jgi:hypothetical protein